METKSVGACPGSLTSAGHYLSAWRSSTSRSMTYKPLQVLAAALDGLEARVGFLASFCAPDPVWPFRLPRVRSINASGHKFGLAPLGVGWVLWQKTSDLPEGWCSG